MTGAQRQQEETAYVPQDRRRRAPAVIVRAHDRFLAWDPALVAEFNALGAAVAARVAAWDLPTRVFKWSLVASVSFAWVSTYLHDDSMTLHRLNGYFALSLVMFRVVWGFIGAPTARFSNFFAGPLEILSHLRDVAFGRARHFIGHNPAGGAMILGLLGIVGLQALTGLFSTDGVFASGPFADSVGDTLSFTLSMAHKVIAKLLLLFIAVHVAANVMYQFFKKEPLITAMVTGEKPAGDYVDEPAEGGAGVVVAITVYATCLGLVLGTVYWFSGSLLGGA